MSDEPRREIPRLEPIPYATPGLGSEAGLSRAKTALNLAIAGFALLPVVGCMVGSVSGELGVLVLVASIIAISFLAIGFGMSAKGQLCGARGPARWRANSAIFMGIVQLALISVTIHLPPLGRSRPAANRIKSASNLRQIGQALELYGGDFGVYPPDFGTLLLNEDLTPGVFVNPNSTDCQSLATTKASQAKDINAGGRCCSYIFTARSAVMQPSVPTRIDAYERPGADRKGGNFLYADGHVDFIDNPEAKRLMAELNAGHNPPRAAPQGGK
jgi:prepilin-type processing-associated H-X9-DG protein